MAQSGPDPDEVVFERLRRAWQEHGDEVIAFRRKDMRSDLKWQGYLNDAAEIYGKRRG